VTISNRSRKLLWGRSGNLCAICRRLLVVTATDGDVESIVGEECHIRARSGIGPRGGHVEPQFVDAYENLLLLCPGHHKQVDDQRTTYPSEVLLALKQKHEQWVHSTLDASSRSGDGFFGLPNTHRANPHFVPHPEAQATLESLRAGEIVVLHGLGGVGKTQHAVQFAHARRAEFRVVLWTSADTLGGCTTPSSRLTTALGERSALVRQREIAFRPSAVGWPNRRTGCSFSTMPIQTP
jgi:hypothetical protein